MNPLSYTSRRDFLTRSSMGIGGLALASLLSDDKLLAAPHLPREERKFDLEPKAPPKKPRATAMISLFMNGGPSHVDLFDPKPELTKRNGVDYGGEVVYSFVNRASKKLMGTPWKFEKRGQCGMDISELLPHIGSIADEICLVRSMTTGINGHEPSIWSMNTGRAQPGRPALGSWLTYALGSESQDLPAYMVLVDPGGLPVDGVRNWSNGWLPPLYQGTVLRAAEPRIFNLDPPAHLRGARQARSLDLLAKINRRHSESHPGEHDLEARIKSYELAARMQVAAKEALDISGEPEHVKKLYGLDNEVTREYGSRLLIARRLVERGVRFVQVFIAGQIWDNHQSIRSELPKCCAKTDKPAAGLVMDLKARGLLDSTVVHWGGEIGRLPVVEGKPGDPNCGRDHNGQGFSTWLAGGGFKGGVVYGETDEVGHRAATNVVTPNDYQATLLHLFGFEPTKLMYHHNGQEQRLVDNTSARVVSELLA